MKNFLKISNRFCDIVWDTGYQITFIEGRKNFFSTEKLKSRNLVLSGTSGSFYLFNINSFDIEKQSNFSYKTGIFSRENQDYNTSKDRQIRISYNSDKDTFRINFIQLSRYKIYSLERRDCPNVFDRTVRDFSVEKRKVYDRCTKHMESSDRLYSYEKVFKGSELSYDKMNEIVNWLKG